MKYVLTGFLFLLHFVLKSQTFVLTNGYTDKSSYHPNEQVVFFTKATNNSGIANFPIQDINGVSVGSVSITLSTQPGMNTNSPWANGYAYTSTGTWIIPSTLKSGMYTLEATQPIAFIVKAPYHSAADIVIICPTNTDQAYAKDPNYTLNGLSYINMYGQTDANLHNIYAPIVSLARPIENAHQQYYRGFLKWIEPIFPGGGHSLNVISDEDMIDYGELQNAKLIIVIGHSEYWTRAARNNFDKFVDQGNDAIVLSGNTMWWQVRHEYLDPATGPVTHQMVCYRGGLVGSPHNNFYEDEPNHCDPLTCTYGWNNDDIKYSILGSIGSDFHANGGYGKDIYDNDGTQIQKYEGFNGHKIVLPASPILAGTGLSFNDILTDINPAVEMDGTLIKKNTAGKIIDRSGNEITSFNSQDPVLDLTALGFYRGEIIAYELPSYDPRDYSFPHCISPIMVFQKTCTSGKIINMNTDFWCVETSMNNTQVSQITLNSILLLLNHNNVFTTPVPDEFRLTPAATTVSYQGCTNSVIHFTPCGMYFNNSDGFKVDNRHGEIVGEIIDCFTCEHGHSMGLANGGLLQSDTTDNKSATNTFKDTQIIPNPNNGIFQLLLNTNKQDSIKEIKICDMMGKTIWSTGASSSNIFNVDLSDYSNGIYYVRCIKSSGEVETKKLIKQ